MYRLSKKYDKIEWIYDKKEAYNKLSECKNIIEIISYII
jgi:hypothetical protein